MQAVAFSSGFDAVGFAQMMAAPSSAFYLNLTHATLNEVIDEYIKFKSTASPHYAEQWHTTKAYIARLRFYAMRAIMPVDVGELFYPHLIRIMLSSGCASTTVEHTLSQIRSALSWGNRYGAPVSPTYDKISFKGRPRKKTSLTYRELCHVYFFNIRTLVKQDGKPYRQQWYRRMEKTRDMFIFSCLFGQRFSDAVRITQKNFDGDIFTITQQKTGRTVEFNHKNYVFDKKIARELLAKYDYTAPYRRNISTYDRSLKELFRAIGGEFGTTIRTEEKILGEIVVRECPRWDIISSHTARRTTITYWANRNMSLPSIQQMSGHADLRTLQEYIVNDVDD